MTVRSVNVEQLGVPKKVKRPKTDLIVALIAAAVQQVFQNKEMQIL